MRSPGKPFVLTKTKLSGPSRKRSISMHTVTMIDAMTEPVMLPFPPSTTMSRILYVRPNTNIRGSIVCMRCPSKAPPIPAIKPDMIKLIVLTFATLIPIASAAISLSRIALSELPKAELISATVKTIARIAQPHTT